MLAVAGKRILAVERCSVDLRDINGEEGLPGAVLGMAPDIQTLQRLVVNFHCEKKCSDELKKALKRTITLECEVKTKGGGAIKERSHRWPNRTVPYSPISLLFFDEEEYFSQPIEGKENILEGVAEVEAEGEKGQRKKLAELRAACKTTSRSVKFLALL
ncbi:hypothetical protein Acr_28g0001210 [Actinidia rufa]|uniref:Uncharacterized protein n=1 Tax=Actinidia rufa TaxID=165716 RepID=A0A7J0H8L0_9ERIC|nr:hypothetical protein Acr_28g0001210 [Actinidia rufa]